MRCFPTLKLGDKLTIVILVVTLGDAPLRHIEAVRPTSSRKLSLLTSAIRKPSSAIFEVGYRLKDQDSFCPMRCASLSYVVHSYPSNGSAHPARCRSRPITSAEAESIRSALQASLAGAVHAPEGSRTKDAKKMVPIVKELIVVGGYVIIAFG